MNQRNNSNPVLDLTQQHQQRQLNDNQLPNVKPNSIYINPSFVPKQPNATRRKDLDLLLEKRLAAELLESDQPTQNAPNTAKTTTSTINTTTSSPSQIPPKTSKGPTKRKSNENSNNNSPSINYKSEAFSKKPANSRRDQSQSDAQPPTKKPAPSTSKVATPPATAHQTTSSVIVIDDPDYSKKLEEQKRKREELLRMKEEKRTQRILEASKSKNEAVTVASTTSCTNNSASTQKNNAPHAEEKPARTVIATSVVVHNSVPTKVNRIVTKTNTPLQMSSNTNGPASPAKSSQPLAAAKRLIIQNLSLNTTDKNLISMCNSINLKDKVKEKLFFCKLRPTEGWGAFAMNSFVSV